MAKSVFRRFPADDLIWQSPDADESDGGVLFFQDVQAQQAWEIGEDFWEAEQGPPTIVGAGNIASAAAFGSPTAQANAVGAGGIASAEAFGQPTVQEVSAITGAGGIATAEAWGQPSDRPQLAGGTIPSSEAWGQPTVQQVTIISGVGGIASVEAWGQPSGTLDLQLTASGDAPDGAGIHSEEAWGSPAVSEGEIEEPTPPAPAVFYGSGGLPAPVDVTESEEEEVEELLVMALL